MTGDLFTLPRTATPSAGQTRASRLSGLLSRISMLLLLTVLTACGARPETGFLIPSAESADGANTKTLLIATTRQRDAREGTFFNGERSHKLDFAQVSISVPPNHVPGEVEVPASAPGNPATEFTVRQAHYVDGEKQFIAHLNAQLAQRPVGKRHVLVFIHGYNTMFAEGIYRLTQMAHDSQSPAVPVLFTWASRGRIGEYVYDNNSATEARDDLERTLRLAFASNAERVDILAHSMGNWVTVEAMRQLIISKSMPPVSRVGNVVLAAPDIDVDVFKSQMRRLGKPSKPFYIILSKDDRALKLSSFLAGQDERLGSYSNVEELNALGAVVIDLTDVKALDSANHNKFAQLAAIAPQMQQVLERGIHGQRNSLLQERSVGEGTLEAIINAPVSILGAPIRIFTAR